MASLISELAISGSRKSDGSANASGRCWVYLPGTTTRATIYGDAAESAPISNPVTLDAGGKAKIYVRQKVDIFLETSSRLPIDTLTINARAEATEVKNAGFTGTLPSGSLGAGGATDLDAVLTSIAASVGGLDGLYKEFTGATSRKIADKFREAGVSVKDYGAKGNGIADDTSAIQRAINEASRLGGVSVRVPAGTYLLSSALTLSSASGVSVVGEGQGVSILKGTNTGAGVFILSSCSGFSIRGIGISHSSASTASAVKLTDCGTLSSPVLLSDLIVQGYLIGLELTGACNSVLLANSYIAATTGNATARAVKLNCTVSSTRTFTAISNTLLGNSGSAVGFLSSSVGHFFVGNYMDGFTSFNIDAAFTGGIISAAGNYMPGGQSIASATAPFGYRVVDFAFEGTTVDVASGGTVTPDRTKGDNLRIRATSTGVAITVNAPTPPPSSFTSQERAVFYTISFYNNAGGAITGWTMNAAYHTSAGPSTTDGQVTSYIFKWDPDKSVWREYSRSVTT